MAPGYYRELSSNADIKSLILVAFITAGLYTSLGRQFRNFLRPHFLATQTSSPNSMPKYPYPNLGKRAYDVVGWFMVQANLNYVAASFMLLQWKDCIAAWNRMGWYGHICIDLAMAFFKFGGRRYLRKGIKKEDKPVYKVQVSPPSPPRDERDPTDIKWVRHALDNPDYQDSGEGVHPDGGLVDEWVKGSETPGLDARD